MHVWPLPHDAPSNATCAVQPFLGLQLSIVHGLPSSQAFLTPTQPLGVQVAFNTHTLPGSHAEPSATSTCLQTADAPSHASVVHGSPSLQSLTWPTHEPLRQASFFVQLLPCFYVYHIRENLRLTEIN